MRTRHHSWTDRILAILARAADIWLNVVFRLVFAPGLKQRLRTKADVDEVMRQLYRADAHITRAIYKTARRLAGLPRIPCPIEAFYRPPLKTADHVVSLYVNCEHKLTHHRTRAARLAWRWLREDERRERDPLCDLRNDLTKATGACLPLSQSDWGRWIGAKRQDGGGSPNGILSHRTGLRVRAPP